MASDHRKARGKESPEPPEPPTPKAAKHTPSESPAESTAAQYCPEVELPCCVRCEAAAKLELVDRVDDSTYIFEWDDFKDLALQRRVIHYRRKKWITGFFHADCLTNYPSTSGVFYVGHHTGIPDKKKKLIDSLEFAIDEYNKHKGDNLTWNRILYATQECYASLLFYITFTGQSDKSGGLHTYQTAVSYEFIKGCTPQVYIFRRKSNANDDYGYEYLLTPPDESLIESTRVKKELMHNLDGLMSEDDPFYEDYVRIRQEQTKNRERQPEDRMIPSID